MRRPARELQSGSAPAAANHSLKAGVPACAQLPCSQSPARPVSCRSWNRQLRHWNRQLAVLFVLTLFPGCVWHAPLSVRRMWFDFNTLGKPALVYEKTDRLPPRAFEVDVYRWMYNSGPGEQITALQRGPQPVAAPRIWSLQREGSGEEAYDERPPVERGPHPPADLPPRPEL